MSELEELAVAQHLAPDWVLVGARSGEAFAVYGSTEMTSAELRAVIKLGEPRRLGRALYTPHDQLQRYELTASLKQFVVGFGPDYATALGNVMNIWQPPEPGPAPPLLNPAPAE